MSEAQELGPRTQESTPGSHKVRRGFSEPAKQNMLAMLHEMTESPHANALDSALGLAEVHQQIKSGLVKDKEVVSAVRQLVNTLIKRGDEESLRVITRIEEVFLAPHKK